MVESSYSLSEFLVDPFIHLYLPKTGNYGKDS